MKVPQKTTIDYYADVLKQILAEVTGLREEIETHANQRPQLYKSYFHDGFISKSAYNLAHYLAMRQYDFRHLQDLLA
jgi:pyruvate kinase